MPRRLGMKNPDELSLRLAGLLKIAMIAVWPATALLTVTANGVLYLMGIKPEKRGAGHRGRDPYAAYRGK